MAEQPVIIDVGTKFTKAGFSEDDDIRAIFPTVLGREKRQGDTYVGDDAIRRRGILSLSNPIKNGLVTNWDDLELIWNHALTSELRVDPQEQPLILSQSTLEVKGDREKTAELLFERQRVPALLVMRDAVLSMYSVGHSTGLSLQIGEESIRAVPVYEGFAIPSCVRRVEIGGANLTQYYSDFVMSIGCETVLHTEREFASDIKHKLACVALDFEAQKAACDTSSSVDRTYELPDGQVIQIGSVRFEGPEMLFDPSRAGVGGLGLSALVHSAITSCDKRIQFTLTREIILDGQASRMDGLCERIEKDVSVLGGREARVRVPPRRFGAFVGGTVVATLGTFPGICISRAEYEEIGPRCVRCKVF